MTAGSRNPPHAADWLSGGSEMGQRIRTFDWANTPLGPIESWPQSLRSAVSILLPSKAQIAMFWGPDLITLYNDAYAPVFGKKHPSALGLPIREAWSELWGAGLKNLFEGVLETGEAFWANDRPFYMERFGYPEETFFDISYDPIRDETGKVGGLFCIVNDTTARVVSERRLQTLRDLSLFAAAEAKSVEEACRSVFEILSVNRHDLPFALLYLLDKPGNTACLAGSVGLDPGTAAAPATLMFDDADHQYCWPFGEVLRTGHAVEVTDVIARCGKLPAGVWPESPNTAIVMPISSSGFERAAGFLVAGISPRRPLDDQYRGFFEVLTTQIANTIANARAYEEERLRAEALAEIDRAKTVFFSNVSHEFRTPLTLIVGPVADLLAEMDGSFAPPQREQLEIAHRNALRLQKLVNTMLDFSRIEAGRMQASYEPTDLASLTADLASNFRAACEKASLELIVECPPMSQPVYVDPDMWEKIVLNLISNAFKYTLAGRIEVTLTQSDDRVELAVRDTGVGISPEELPKLFERFYRVGVSRGRTQEGSGIGLALVRELVKLHGGSVNVVSTLDQGSVFTVSMPLGMDHLPADRIGAERTLASTALGAASFVSEALRWIPNTTDVSSKTEAALMVDSLGDVQFPREPAGVSRYRILLADDNADMRDYLKRLLSTRYEVVAARDGEAAWDQIQQNPPDLILSDVMMPKVDGFELLRRLRADETTREIPLILLSARAGEEARIEGLQASANDYLVKPFSARELLATVNTQIKTEEIRRERHEALRASEERYRHIFEQSIDGVFVATPEGRYVDVSPSGCEMLGMTREEVLNSSFAEVLPPEEVARISGEVGKFVDGKVHRSEWRFRRKDGSIFVGEVAGRQLRDGHLQGIVRDITERKRAEQQLAAELEATKRLHALSLRLGSADNLDAALEDLLENAIACCNADFGCVQLYNLQTETLEIVTHKGLPQSYVEFFRNVGRGDVTSCARSMHTGKRVLIEDVETDSSFALHRDLVASAAFRAVQSTPLQTHDGRLLGMLSTHFREPHKFSDRDERLLDLYARHAADLIERFRFEAALKEADRRKDEFLATLAHELRNPLAPICNSLQLIQLAEQNPRARHQAVTIIERQVHHLVRLVDDLLDVARINSNKLELRKEFVTVEQVVKSAVETSRPFIESSGHQLQVSLPAQPITLDADPVRLAQAISNLLNNAAKYSESGTRISLIATKEGNELLLTVRDSGIGIEADQLRHIFEMFMQVEPSQERAQGGLGIGLTLVQRLVQMHGGSVEAYSGGLNQGSEFVIRLPLAMPPPAVRSTATRALHTVAALPRRRILVVDDNVDSAESMSMMLTMLGHEVAMAHDGVEAVETAESFRPEVAFLDLGMPRLNGYEAARSIRERPWGQKIVLVALTGWGQDEDKRRTTEAGFDAHLVKPINFDDLDAVVSGRGHTLNEK